MNATKHPPSSCSYDCAYYPSVLRPNPDITGKGISFAFTITAVLALCLVVAHYLIVYRPDVNQPEPSEGLSHDDTFRPNPIDVYMLSWRIEKKTENGTQEVDLPKGQTRVMFTQCMLVMSDFQLLTGLSVLVSGYTQLRCGLAIYHWERILNLAWFSAITHLCCLTFLRDHFRKERLAQVWRIPCMIVLVGMIAAGLIPSARYPGTFYTEHYASWQDFAICFYEPFSKRPGHTRNLAHRMYPFKGKLQRTVLAVILLILGMLVRLWRLYRAPMTVYNRVRQSVSHIVRSLLTKTLVASNYRSTGGCTILIFVHRPLLASFLFVRMILDILTSRMAEVWWLAVGLTWGFLGMYPPASANPDNVVPTSWLPSDSDDKDWTFGQVMALVALAAPVLTLVEAYITNRYADPARIKDIQDLDSTSHSLIEDKMSTATDQGARTRPESMDDPAYDFYHSSASYTVLVCAFIVQLLATSTYILYTLFSVSAVIPLTEFLEPSPIGPYFPVFLGLLLMCTLNTIVIAQHEPQAKFCRFWVRILWFIMCSTIYVPSIVVAPTDGGMKNILALCLTLATHVAIYIGLTVLDLRSVRSRFNTCSPVRDYNDNESLLVPTPEQAL